MPSSAWIGRSSSSSSISSGDSCGWISAPRCGPALRSRPRSWARLPISLEIAILATVIAIAIAIPLGAVSALKQNTWIDIVVRVFAVGGIATPSFWLGIMSVLVVLNFTSAVFGTPWMPPIEYVPIWQDPIRNLSMAFLPAVTVGYRYAAVSMRMTRSAMLEVMQEDYIRTARAKGLIKS